MVLNTLHGTQDIPHGTHDIPPMVLNTPHGTDHPHGTAHTLYRVKIFQSYQGPIPELFECFVDNGIGATSMPRCTFQIFLGGVAGSEDFTCATLPTNPLYFQGKI